MAHRLLLKNFRIVDETTDLFGSVVVEDGLIRDLIPGPASSDAGLVIDGSRWCAQNTGGPPVLLPALVDLHAHFRDPGLPQEGRPPRETGVLAETLESAGLAAAAGGYGTVVCMANTNPVIDTPGKAARLKKRSDALGLIDLYPALSLTRGMEGGELSGIADLPSPEAFAAPPRTYGPRLLSEDGRDVEEAYVFSEALAEARRLGIPVSCHCDVGGPEAEIARQAGQGRDVLSRIEENHGTLRAIVLGREAGCHIHIAHVSTREAVDLIREVKKSLVPGEGPPGEGASASFSLTCEAAPHHIALTCEDALRLGAESHGRVNPPLRLERDRQALIAAVLDGTIDAIATDHAPHTRTGKAGGAPGFIGLETAFGVCFTELVRNRPGGLSLSRLSALMSGTPARILGLGGDRGRIAEGFRADLVIADINAARTVKPDFFKSRGRNSPFSQRKFWGIILMTIHGGRIVFQAPV
jgi:dihydroorotase